MLLLLPTKERTDDERGAEGDEPDDAAREKASAHSYRR